MNYFFVVVSLHICLVADLLLSSSQFLNMMNKTMKKEAAVESGISSLPPELLEEIILRALSSSPTPIRDIRSLRRTCKNFHAICSSKRIGKSMSVEDWSMYWHHKEGYFRFLQTCAESENVNASFLLGFEEMINLGRFDIALHHLQFAASQGHIPSKYIMGLFLLRDESSRSYAMDLLNEVSNNADQCKKQASKIYWTIIWEKWPELLFLPCEDLSCGALNLGGDNQWLHGRMRFCSDAELRTSGGSLAELRASNGGPAELRTSGGDLMELRASSSGPTELRMLGGGPKKLTASDGGMTELRMSGGDLVELRASGGGPAELRMSGGGLAELRASGRGLAELRMSGGGPAGLRRWLRRSKEARMISNLSLFSLGLGAPFQEKRGLYL
ncbi:hypothetical protein IEQ34_006867 [Dendrobium chrysotoxum]|uniref:At2g35280-like TPR domain-containing protein n=1 Tax=Dendrobium chrysotoxum TaxID=161865 RepID=A0AAV7H5C0_DENCH|nr:hypothetical protein IEQ34_006867 [Dendrobium chrysotoxum]